MTVSNYAADPVLDATAGYLLDATSAISTLAADITGGLVVVTPRNVESIRLALTTMTSQAITLVSAIEASLAIKSGMN